MNRLYLLIIFVSCLIQLNSSTEYICDRNISCGCSTASTIVTARIVGGEIAPDHAWGWTIQLQVSQEYRCTAVLISSEYALTSAHCVTGNFAASELSIKAGTNDLHDTSETVQIRQINKFYRHPLYDKVTTLYDIAVLHFSPLTVSSTSTINFICLPTMNVNPFSIGSNVVVTGWGVTNFFSTTPFENLLQVTVQVFSPTSVECIQGKMNSTTLQICAGVKGGGKDACAGDSGGPLMFFDGNKWILAGLSSTGLGCGESSYPGLYTNVSPFIDFIQYVINNQSLSSNSATNHKNLIYKLIFFLLSCLLILTNI